MERQPGVSKVRFTRLLAVLLLIGAGCSDGGSGSASSTGPSSSLPFPAGTVLTIVSGETGDGVSNATVVLAGKTFSSDAAGRLVLPEGFGRNSLLDMLDPAFVDRQTFLREPGALRFSLWPQHSPTGLDPDFTRNAVYDGSAGRPRRMLRITPGTTDVYFVPSEQIRGDRAAMEEIDWTARTMTDITRGEIRFLVSDAAPSGALAFDLVVDPGDSALLGAVAAAKRKTSGWAITGGTVVYAAIGTVRTSTTPHEMGHMFGLGHSTDPRDIMTTGRHNRSGERFSPREELAMRLMLQRLPGNELPDNDRSASSPSGLKASPSSSLSILRCEG